MDDEHGESAPRPPRAALPRPAPPARSAIHATSADLPLVAGGPRVSWAFLGLLVAGQALALVALRARPSGLSRALTVSLLLALATAAFLVVFREYYVLPPSARADSRWHALLRPSGTLGLAFGVAATLLVLANLSYLIRRSRAGQGLPGSLRAWMNAHVVTGILAALLSLLHGAMAPRNAPGGQALAALAVLLLSGALGRWLYAFVPRAASGRELQADEVRVRLAAATAERDGHGRGLPQAVLGEIHALAAARPWQPSFVRRVRALIAGEGELRRLVARLEREGRAGGLPRERVAQLVTLAREAHRTALGAAHAEDLRGLLSSWRIVHRFVALLLLLLLAFHVVTALRYGGAAG
jgi:dihydropyrimidine dehydrogenase (NAD+) subunit PreT